MQKNVNRIVAFGIFLITMIMYCLTLSQTVVFWDVGEFCAAGYLLQVPHPPGAPLWLLFIHLASMLPTSADPAVRMHGVAALSAAFSVMFTYLISVRFIELIRGKTQTMLDAVLVYGAAACGAFAFAFCYTCWFNAVEAEVYANAAFFFTAIMWLAMVWHEHAHEPRNEKYILLVAYVMGVSIGTHLEGLLCIFSILMIIFFRHRELPKEKPTFSATVAALALAGIVLMYFGYNEAIGWLSVMVLLAVVFVVANQVTMKVFIPYTAIGLAVFFIIYIGIIQKFPDMLDGEVGGAKNIILQLVPFGLVIGAVWAVFYSQKNKRKILNIAAISFLFIIIGYSTYTLVMVRANVTNMPMNENEPKDLAGLSRYISREQYGSQPLVMPRRWSPEPQHQGIYTNYKTDTEFMWKYQIDHMFSRYMEWNFINRPNDDQDSGFSWLGTKGIRFMGIPFLLALFGMYYHIRKDWKMGMVMFSLFIVTGVILALYQNQQQPQPRERDYFYFGAYYVYGIWIAIGIVGFVDGLVTVLKKQSLPALTYGTIAFSIVAVPVNMVLNNYTQNNRTGNYVAWDYSYNILQSCPPNAILFTNGDNDTFPLWFLQDVEGVRQDVRIANLSLINTEWYIKQLKNNSPHGALQVPIEFSDEEIDELQPMRWQATELSIPITTDALKKYSPEATTLTGVSVDTSSSSKVLKFTLNPTMEAQGIKAIRIQDRMVYEIIRANHWKRPIVFAVTCSPDSKIGLDDYLWYQGLGWELKPYKNKGEEEGIDTGVLEKQIMSDITPSKTPQYGYLYRNLNNPNVFYDENQKRMIQNYRTAFLRLAIYYNQNVKDDKKSNEILTRMEQLLPRNVIPMDWRLYGDLRTFYRRLGNKEMETSYSNDLEAECLRQLANNEGDLSGYYSPYRFLLEIYSDREDYQKAIDLLNSLKRQRPNDKTIDNQIKSYEAQLATKKQAPVQQQTSSASKDSGK